MSSPVPLLGYLLLIHPDAAFRARAVSALPAYNIVGCDTPREGLVHFHQMPKVDLILVDANYKQGPWMDDMVKIHELNRDIEQVYLNAEAGTAEIQSILHETFGGDGDIVADDKARVQEAKAAVKTIEIDHLKNIVDTEVEKRTAIRPARALANVRHDEEFFQGMIGESAVLRELKQKIMRIAPTTATVLLTGESGTGKEVAARAVVAASMRAHKPFVVINAAAIPNALLESELFGHEKGAFTNAVKTRKGKFELAHEGTLFLDEIGDMPMESQAKLLRALEQGEVDRVGGEVPIRVDVRLIAATNANLLAKVEAGEFREDLFYRLDVIHFELPPLRQRSDDIPLLLNFYLSKLKDQYHQHKAISMEAVRKMMDYTWPGNIRQLRNTLERAYLLSVGDNIEVGDIDIRQAPSTTAEVPGDKSLRYDGTLEDLEMRVILDTLERTGGNKTEAARILGIGTKTLYRKLEKNRKVTDL